VASLFLGPLAYFGAAAVDWLLFRLGEPFQARMEHGLIDLPMSSSRWIASRVAALADLLLASVSLAREPMAQAHLDFRYQTSAMLTPKQVGACLTVAKPADLLLEETIR